MDKSTSQLHGSKLCLQSAGKHKVSQSKLWNGQLHKSCIAEKRNDFSHRFHQNVEMVLKESMSGTELAF